MSDRNESQRAYFDDGQLLDYALGLDADPELMVALSGSARLRQRLAELESDLAAIEADLLVTIPPVCSSRAEPGWPCRACPRHWLGGEWTVKRWRRLTAVLAAALAAAVATAVMAVAWAPTPRFAPAFRPPASGPVVTDAGRQPAVGGAALYGVATPSGAATPSPSASVTPKAAIVATGAVAFRVVAVAHAGPLRGTEQLFRIARTLKGRPPASFSLALRGIGAASQDGSLVIVYLRPLTSRSSPELPEFSYGGRPARVEPLPAGTDPSAVRLP